MSSEVSLIDREECSVPGADDILATLPGRVRDIAALRGLGFTCMDIGRRFGITPQAVSATRTTRAYPDGLRNHPSTDGAGPARAANALSRIGVNSRADARGRDVFTLLSRERNCGTKSLDEIRRWLERGENL